LSWAAKAARQSLLPKRDKAYLAHAATKVHDRAPELCDAARAPRRANRHIVDGPKRAAGETFAPARRLCGDGRIHSQEAVMPRAFARSLCILGFVVALAAPAARADGQAGAPPARALIERQLDAFAHDDAAAAYALAAPGLKKVFTDPDNFIAMVRASYAPVYRHQSVEFGRMEIDGDNVSQVLTIVDADNVVWKALYKLARQPDGQWLINGCLLIKSTDIST